MEGQVTHPRDDYRWTGYTFLSCTIFLITEGQVTHPRDDYRWTGYTSIPVMYHIPDYGRTGYTSYVTC